MQQPANPNFAEHPGQITTFYAWNKTSKTEAATSFPDTLKWKYYAQDGSETADIKSAKYRVPVVEIRIVSVDSKGVPVDPQHAARLSIDTYGPDRKFLSHTDARAHP